MQRNIKKRKPSSPFEQEDTRGIDSKESKTNNPFSRGIFRQKRSCFKMKPRAETGKSAKGNRLTVRLLDNSFEQEKTTGLRIKLQTFFRQILREEKQTD
jgi:hypothetical protein